MKDSHESNDRLGLGTYHTDERDPLAYAYEGDELLTVLYKKMAVRECESSSWITVVRTPKGEEVADG